MSTARSSLNRRDLLRLAGAALGTPLAAPALGRGAEPVHSYTGTAFATGWHIALHGPADPPLLQDIRVLLDTVDRQMSPYRADSDITRVNHAAAGACAVPDELRTVTAAALEIAAASDGAFDPTVGPLVSRWGFGPIEGDQTPRWTGLGLDAGRIVKDDAALTLDLCGIAKGYALDRLAGLLAAAGHDAFFVDLGGEVFARGLHPSGRAWQVGVEDPRPETTGIAEVLTLTDRAVATSGDRENGYTLGARRYSHIIAPRDRAPVAGGIASVSVIGPDAMHADGWATALMAAGPETGPALARALDLPALFLLRDGAGLARLTSGDFDRHLA